MHAHITTQETMPVTIYIRVCIHISHASAVKPEISMCSSIDIVLHSMKCIVTILEPDFLLLSVEHSFFFLIPNKATISF